MAGVKGRSGGANRKSLETHLLNGTFRPSRHGGWVAPPVPAAVAAPVEPVPADLVEGLTGRGKAFVEQCWAEYEGWTSSKRALLREAGVLLDQLETLRGQRGERHAQRLLLSVVAALRFEEAGHGTVPAPASAPASKWAGLLK